MLSALARHGSNFSKDQEVQCSDAQQVMQGTLSSYNSIPAVVVVMNATNSHTRISNGC
jgi:hypothetical protein